MLAVRLQDREAEPLSDGVAVLLLSLGEVEVIEYAPALFAIFWEPGRSGWTMNGLSKTLLTLDDLEELSNERDALRWEPAAGLRSPIRARLLDGSAPH